MISQNVETTTTEVKEIKQEEESIIDEYESSEDDSEVEDIEKSLEPVLKRKHEETDPKQHKFSIQKTVLKNIVKEMIGPKKSISKEAMKAIRIAAEQHLIDFFQKAQALSEFNERKTVSIADIQGVRAIQSTNYHQLKQICDDNKKHLEKIHSYRDESKKRRLELKQ